MRHFSTGLINALFNMSQSRSRVRAHIIGLKEKDVALLTLLPPKGRSVARILTPKGRSVARILPPKSWCEECGKCGIKNE